METIDACVVGLDVHKTTVVACTRRVVPIGRACESVQSLGTMIGELLALSDWLAGHGVIHVAMESTRFFRMPILNILEGSFEAILVNLRPIYDLGLTYG